MYTSAAAAFALLAAGASAMVIPRDDCSDILEYRNLHQSPIISLPSEIVSNVFCTSLLTETCELSKGYAHTTSVEYSITGGVSFSLGLGKIAELGVEASFTYTWGTSDEVSEGSTLICPPGGFQCGVMGSAQVVNITGEARLPAGGLGCPGDNEWHSFNIQAPLKEAKNAQGTVTNFQPCLLSCGSAQFPESCDAAYAPPPEGSGIAICPSPRTAPCQGSFGGVCGSVPATPE
ncbi:hypothetical protein BCR34DRAFT_598849 [Clohesyomyces aquaticus]|uniref:Uncharacterized protein n=1 Tax=Clohesyomyces aquaticus TaxID=1231657 RepID=A0A1Y1ZXJ4_9PLEO|nr:hypothetical protein BCR34DRAFT_598849 [Clohesyomyces aquaticus]